MPEPFASAMRGSLLDRTALLPYRYTAAAAAAQTGLCPVRGMHFDFPAEPDAYATPGQFMLGADLLVAPAWAPVAGPPIPPAGGAGAFGAVNVSIWVPPGDWRDFWAPARGALPPGAWTSYAADLATVPVLVRGGAAIAMLPRALAAVPGASARQYSALAWRVFPGAPLGVEVAGEAYEDDGASTDYLAGASAVTALRYTATAAGLGIAIATTGAGYAGMVAEGRLYSIELLASAAPARVAQNGAPLARSDAGAGAPGTWARTAAGDTLIYLNACSAREAQQVEVAY